MVDGKEKSFEAYNINGNNYFKLRDIAFTLINTSNQFEVMWNSDKNAINLQVGKPYTVVGGEMSISPKNNITVEAIPSTSKIYLNDKEVSMTIYNINGNNYFKLRDIASAIGFEVGWDSVNSVILIETVKKDAEIQRAIAYGIVPDEIQSDYNKTITFAQYSQMLTNLIEIWDDSRLSEWKAIISEAAKSDKEMKREDGILAASYAIVLMGANTYSSVLDGREDISEDEMDEQMRFLSWNYPNFKDWDKVVYPAFKGNYMWGGVRFLSNKVSRVSKNAIFPYDFEKRSMHLQEPLTRQEAIQSVIRLAEIDATILEPEGNYVSVDTVGTYNKNIITDELLSKPSKLPVVTQSKLPSEWKGIGYGSNKDGRHPYNDFSESDIRYMTDNGFNMTRLFLGFSTLRFPDYPKDPRKINTRELEDLDQLVAWCIKYDIHLQISMVNLPTRIEYTYWHDNYPTQEEWKLMAEYWQMLSKRYKDIPNEYLSFDLCNELDPGQSRINEAKEAIKKTVEAIRQADSDRVMLYSFPGNPDLAWADAMASLGLAIGCHPYYPQYITTSDYKYAEQNPYAKPTWPLAWFPMGQISTCKAPLTITGEVSGATISLHFRDINDANVEVLADGKMIKTFLPEKQQHGLNNNYGKLYTAAIPVGTKEIKVRVTRGFAYIDTIILKGTFGEVFMMPHDVCDFPDTSDPLPLVVKANGTYTNSENRMIDGNAVFEADVLPLLNIAEKYGVGFMVNEFGIFSIKVDWDIDVVVSYHDTLLEMLEEKGIGWCYCELFNPFGKHIVLVTGESQWEGTIVSKVSYPYDDRIDILYFNQQLLDVFRKYTKNK